MAEAFVVADALYEDSSINFGLHSIDRDEVAHNSDEGAYDEPTAAAKDAEVAEEHLFDEHDLHEAMRQLYQGARCTKLVATILLMNLCAVHGVSNNCTDELFAILYGHILPEENCLPKNHHAAWSLTQKLDLSYNNIHACNNGCVLLRGEYADLLRCPKCNGPRYRDEEQNRFLLKVMRHFPIIPQLRRIFKSLSISKLMTWHSENRSDQDGGDELVRHPCDSKAWKHFHDNVDPNFGNDSRKVHFALAADGINPFKQNRTGLHGLFCF